MLNKKIVIIGAGPVGCFTAQLLKGYGYKPQLIEEHNEVGKPLHCTGLVGSQVFSEKRAFRISTSSVLNLINGAVIHYDNQHLVLRRKKVAYVIDREKFDKELSQGLEISFGNKFLGLERLDSHYVIETDRDEIPADLVIGADGANSALRKIITENSQVTQYRGIQLRIEAKPRFKDMVEVYLRSSFFVWVVPETENVVRIGTISQNPYRDLQNFLEEKKVKGRVLERFGGLVSVGICERTVKENIAIVGDAACQLKPLTFGGIFFGLKAAEILARSIRYDNLENYDARWKKELAREIKIGLKIRQIYNNLRKEEITKFFKLFKKEKSLIEKIADFENHSRLVMEIIKKPSLYPHLSDLFRIFFKAIF